MCIVSKYFSQKIHIHLTLFVIQRNMENITTARFQKMRTFVKILCLAQNTQPNI